MLSISKHLVENMVNDIWLEIPSDLEQEAFEQRETLEYFSKEVLSGWQYASAKEIEEDTDLSSEMSEFLFNNYCSNLA